MLSFSKINSGNCTKQFICFVKERTIQHVTKAKLIVCCRRWAHHYFLKNIKYYLFVCQLFAFRDIATAQFIIKGKVTDQRQHPIAEASIYMKGRLEGAVTDSAGEFSFRISEKGLQIFVASSVGFKESEMSARISDSVTELNFVLVAQQKALEPVVISAGSFEASDKAKGASLTPMDAMTVAGNGGDISNSLRALPGAQQIGDKEGLFIRGGTGDETKQFVDGTLLKNPNYSSVPGIIQPARINPFLFNGVLFSSGGYSALYGEALSSALILKSVDLPEKSSGSLHIFPTATGAGIQELSKNKKSSFGINSDYGTYTLYDKLIPQKQDFFTGPNYISLNGNFRMKTGETGMLKLYSNYSYNNTGMRNPDTDSMNLLTSFQTKGNDLYANLAYRTSINLWKIDAGLAYEYNKQDITDKLEDSTNRQLFIPFYPYNGKNNSTNINSNFIQARIVITRNFANNQAFRFGAENFNNNDSYTYNDSSTRLKDNLTATFAETDLHITKNIAAKIGARGEYSSLLRKFNVAPRISLAYRFYDRGQINIAYGIFYQKPELPYLIENNRMGYMQATHYIINYQKKANNRLFRIEAYYKKYKNLVTTIPSVTNDGKGEAHGIELFFRDKRTFKNFDYWITYTYLHTKRIFLNYPYELQPNFATPHTASIAIKRFFPNINFDANVSYSIATGRPYYDIKTDNTGKSRMLDDGKTNMYNQLNLSFAYLFNIFKRWKGKDFSGIGFGINNVFGTKEIFNYIYSYNGENKTPVTMPAIRSYYLGLFMTFGIDRRGDIIDQNL